MEISQISEFFVSLCWSKEPYRLKNTRKSLLLCSLKSWPFLALQLLFRIGLKLGVLLRKVLSCDIRHSMLIIIILKI